MAKLDDLAVKNSGDNLVRADMFGLVAKVVKVNTDEKDGKVNIDIEVVVDSASFKAGDLVNIYFTPTGGKDVKCLETLKRGMGRGKDSILMLENCNVDEKGNVQVQWLKQVAVSASKIGEGDERMMKRKFVSGFMEQPVISFRNPVQLEGEPQQIRFGFAAESYDQWVTKNGKGENVAFSREWAVAKLNEVLKYNKEGTKSIQVRTSLYEADNAVKAETVAELRNLVLSHLKASPNNEAVLRITDGSRVMVRNVKNKYLGAAEGNQAPERTVDDLFSRSLFSYKEEGAEGLISIRNEDLDGVLTDPDMAMEMIPGRQIPYFGDMMQSTKSVLVKKFAEDSAEDIRDFSVPFGVGAAQNTLVGMIVVTEPFKTGDVYMAGTPMALARDQFTLEGLPTVNIGGKAIDRAIQPEIFDGGQLELVSEAEIKAEALSNMSAAPTVEENEVAAAVVDEVKVEVAVDVEAPKKTRRF